MRVDESGQPTGEIGGPTTGEVDGRTLNRTRGQANLAALGVALVVLVSVTGVSLAFADGALTDADRAPLERRAAATLADRLVAASSPVTLRDHVVNRTAATNLSHRNVRRLSPAVDGHGVRVRLGGETVYEMGTPAGGTTVRRLVRVGTPEERTRRVSFGTSRAVALTSHTEQVRVDVEPENATVSAVRVDDRVVLQNETGIAGAAQFRTHGRPNATVWFDVVSENGTGYALVTTRRTNASASTLEVTVDA